jgi:hypothetical protein
MGSRQREVSAVPPLIVTVADVGKVVFVVAPTLTPTAPEVGTAGGQLFTWNLTLTGIRNAGKQSTW